MRPAGLTSDPQSGRGKAPQGEDGEPVGLGDLEVLDLCLGECGAAGEDDSPAGGESPAAQVVGRAVGAVGDKLVPVTRGLGSAARIPAGQVDLGAPWSGLQGDGGVD